MVNMIKWFLERMFVMNKNNENKSFKIILLICFIIFIICFIFETIYFQNYGEYKNLHQLNFYITNSTFITLAIAISIKFKI